MYLERKVYSNLKDWKKSDENSLYVIGAPGVGKSYVVDVFAKNEYATNIVVDFSGLDNSMTDFLSNNISNPSGVCEYLSVKYNTPLYKDNSLIVFDNIQDNPISTEVINSIANTKKYDVIGIGIRGDISEENNRLHIYPLSFDEFCIAIGERELLNTILKCFNNKQKMDDEKHEKAMTLYKQYIIVGGMPQSILSYIQNERNIIFSNAQNEDLLKNYNNGIDEIDKKNKWKIKELYNSIPKFLSKNEKRIFVSDIEKKTSYAKSENVIGWLSNSNYVNESVQYAPVREDDGVGDRRKYFKLYLSDTGLLVKHASNAFSANNDNILESILRDDYSSNEGMLLENSIAQNLCSNGHKLKYYTHYNETSHHNDISIDFVVHERTKDGKEQICPIEIKTGSHYSTKSMEKFIEKYKTSIRQAYIIHTKNLEFKKDIMCIPPYMITCI